MKITVEIGVNPDQFIFEAYNSFNNIYERQVVQRIDSASMMTICLSQFKAGHASGQWSLVAISYDTLLELFTLLYSVEHYYISIYSGASDIS